MWTMVPLRPAAMAFRQNTCEQSQQPRRLTSCEPRPLLVGELEERHDGLDPGVIDKDVDRTELFPDLVDHGLDLAPVGHIALDRDGAAAFVAHPAGNILGALRACHVVDGHVGAFLGKDLCDSAPDATTRARDERNFALEFHDGLLPSDFGDYRYLAVNSSEL